LLQVLSEEYHLDSKYKFSQEVVQNMTELWNEGPIIDAFKTLPHELPDTTE
jgi:hypothetical protein